MSPIFTRFLIKVAWLQNILGGLENNWLSQEMAAYDGANYEIVEFIAVVLRLKNYVTFLPKESGRCF